MEEKRWHQKGPGQALDIQRRGRRGLWTGVADVIYGPLRSALLVSPPSPPPSSPLSVLWEQQLTLGWSEGSWGIKAGASHGLCGDFFQNDSVARGVQETLYQRDAIEFQNGQGTTHIPAHRRCLETFLTWKLLCFMKVVSPLPEYSSHPTSPIFLLSQVASLLTIIWVKVVRGPTFYKSWQLPRAGCAPWLAPWVSGMPLNCFEARFSSLENGYNTLLMGFWKFNEANFKALSKL